MNRRSFLSRIGLLSAAPAMTSAPAVPTPPPSEEKKCAGCYTIHRSYREDGTSACEVAIFKNDPPCTECAKSWADFRKRRIAAEFEAMDFEPALGFPL